MADWSGLCLLVLLSQWRKRWDISFSSAIEIFLLTKFGSSVHHKVANLGYKDIEVEKLDSSINFQELRKLIGHFLKLNSSLVSPGQKFLTGLQVMMMIMIMMIMIMLQAKLHYLKIISELPSYGAKCFSTNMSVSINQGGEENWCDVLFL